VHAVAGRIVDHADQEQPRAALLEPGVLAGVPLRQFAHRRPAWSPYVDFLDALLLGTPQLAFDHAGPHGLAPRVNPAPVRQVFRRQCRTEAGLDLVAQDLQRRLPDLRVQLAVGFPAAQPMQERRVALAFQPLQQSPHMPFALADLLGRLPLCDQPFLAFFNATSRSRSCCVMRSVPESTSPA